MLTLTHSCFTTTGNLKSLESLTQLTSVDFQYCYEIEGILNRSHELTTQNMVGQKPVGVASRQHLNVFGMFFAILVGLVVCSNPILHLIFFF